MAGDMVTQGDRAPIKRYALSDHQFLHGASFGPQIFCSLPASVYECPCVYVSTPSVSAAGVISVFNVALVFLVPYNDLGSRGYSGVLRRSCYFNHDLALLYTLF